jgi:rhodanese-related sulfurtransferase
LRLYVLIRQASLLFLTSVKKVDWIVCPTTIKMQDRDMNTAIGPEDLKKLLKSSDVVLLDVRRKADYDADPHLIPGAAWRNPEDVETWSQELSQGSPVVVYCVKGGSVSQSITDNLNKKQVPACYVEGGLRAWKDSGGATK